MHPPQTVRDLSPHGSSDDSAVGSISSNPTHSTSSNSTNNNHQSHHPHINGLKNYSQLGTNNRSLNNFNTIQSINQVINKNNKSNISTINSDDLISAAKQMRRNNVGLIARSIRTHLACFDELDIRKFGSDGDFFVNFISNGINKCDQSTILRPVSILWPTNYDDMTEQLGILDAFLLNTEFHMKPVDWMLRRGLTSVPTCRLCRDKMTLDVEDNLVRWHCQKFQTCTNFYMPIQRPSFFNGYENVGLKKLLFAVYFWATCTPGQDLIPVLNLNIKMINGIWRRIQNVCRTALEKTYPRHRLNNFQDPSDKDITVPVDLISIKLNRVFVVCAKHPSSNFVRLGLQIPLVSLYSFAELTESWFAHGTTIRISERKFLNLARRRPDLKIHLVEKTEMISKDGKFDRNSAFGYIIAQLTHIFKDYDSTGLPIESLKLMLAELQWREYYGRNPYDAFTNIVTHMSQYGESSDCYSEISMPIVSEDMQLLENQEFYPYRTLDCTQFIWAEKYFYATVEPSDEDGNVISRRVEPQNPDHSPPPNALVTCHLCDQKFECFNFGVHLMYHIDDEYKHTPIQMRLAEKNLVECKHCFKTFPKKDMPIHSSLLRTFLQPFKFACRICCVKFTTRDEFLQHMRQYHFEHETPYRCPVCNFSSSFQRDVFLHFSEEHRHNLIVLCLLCLTSFSVGDTIVMSKSRMKLLSKVFYLHLRQHQEESRNYTCSNCCLCFLSKDKLEAHKERHHNPCEIRKLDDKLSLEPFIIDFEEEKHCVKALPAELFIANKRPNLIINGPSNQHTNQRNDPLVPEIDIDENQNGNSVTSNHTEPATTDGLEIIIIDGSSEDSSSNPIPTAMDVDQPTVTMTAHNDAVSRPAIASNLRSGAQSRSSDGSMSPLDYDDTDVIHVRGAPNQFLDGGTSAMTIPKTKSSTKHNTNLPSNLSSEKLISYLSRMKRADGVIPNQSVILTPTGKPAKCCECREYITVDHFVKPINCPTCRYTTLCPRSSTAHYKARHGGGSSTTT